MTASPKWSTALLVAAVPVLVAGSVAWVFPIQAAAAVGGWLLPALSIAALALAQLLAVEWRWLRGFLLVLAVTLVLGWAKVSGSPTSARHLVGVSLGLLLMVIMGRVINSQWRLTWATLAFLASGLVMLLAGLAGTDFRLLMPFDGALAAVIPSVRLGLAGLQRGHVNTNGLAAAALLVTPVGAAVLLMRSKKRDGSIGLRVLGLVGFVVGVVIVVVSQSRAAWMAAWLTLALLLVRGLRPLVWRLVVGAAVVIPPLLAVASLAFFAREKFLLSAGFLWSTLDTRAHIMASGIRLWKQSPWLGIGLNQFRHAHQPRGAWARWGESPWLSGLTPATDAFTAPAGAIDVAHAHNTFLQTALDVGVFGLAAYCGILGFLLVRAAQASRGSSTLCRRVSLGASLSLVAFAVFGLADAVALGAKIGLFQWMVGGLILGSWRVQFSSNRPGQTRHTHSGRSAGCPPSTQRRILSSASSH